MSLSKGPHKTSPESVNYENSFLDKVDPENTFLDNGAYDRFLESVEKSFSEFVEILIKKYPKLEKFGENMKIEFEKKNYANVLNQLEKISPVSKRVHSYPSVVKDIKRLKVGSLIRRDFFNGIKVQLHDILDNALNNNNEIVIWMMKRLHGHQKLEDRKKMLRGKERTIFATKENLCTVYTNEEVREVYKGIIDQIREAETNAREAGNI